jgi:DNA mismatch repair protein MutS
LNLNQIIDNITASKEAYNLKPFFYTSLHDIHTIHYRHAIFRDLHNPLLFKHITSLARKMRTTREHLAQGAKLYHYYQKCSWFLQANQTNHLARLLVEIYCDTMFVALASTLLIAKKFREVVAELYPQKT